MVKFVAHKPLINSALGLDLIGNGSDFLTFQFSGPTSSAPDSIKYFKTTDTDLGLTLHGGESDLVVAAGFPASMTVTGIDGTLNGEAAYELTGCSFEIADYYGAWDNIEDTIFSGDDQIYGSSGRDYLAGGRGDDLIKGGKGRDLLGGNDGANTLSGGKGADIFVFQDLEAPSLADHVTDYGKGGDHLALLGVDVLRYGSDATLRASMFTLGTQAKDGNDHVIYNQKSGTLFYDEDGVGGASKWKLAIFDNHPHLSHSDFVVLT